MVWCGIGLFKMKNIIKNNWLLFLIASLTLGLAPFNPPHVLGKLQWLFGGSAFDDETGMQLVDWLDLLLHGSPWILLSIAIFLNLSSKKEG